MMIASLLFWQSDNLKKTLTLVFESFLDMGSATPRTCSQQKHFQSFCQHIQEILYLEFRQLSISANFVVLAWPTEKSLSVVC